MDDLIKRLRNPNWDSIGNYGNIKREAAEALERMQWNTDMGSAKGKGLILIETYVGCERRVSTGGWDDDWTGECWVYDCKRIPVGTTPVRWMHLPHE